MVTLITFFVSMHFLQFRLSEELEFDALIDVRLVFLIDYNRNLNQKSQSRLPAYRNAMHGSPRSFARAPLT